MLPPSPPGQPPPPAVTTTQLVAGDSRVLVVPRPDKGYTTTTYRVEACNEAALCVVSPPSPPLRVSARAPLAGVVSMKQSDDTHTDAVFTSTAHDGTIVVERWHTPSDGFANHASASLLATWHGFENPSGGNLSYELCIGSIAGACQLMGPHSLHDHSIRSWETRGADESPLDQAHTADLLCGQSYFFTVTAYECTGLTVSADSPALRVCCDRPILEGVALAYVDDSKNDNVATDSEFASSLAYVSLADPVKVTWRLMEATCAGIREVVAELLHVEPDQMDREYEIAAVARWAQTEWDANQRTTWNIVPTSALANLTHGVSYVVRLHAFSNAGRETETISRPFIFDTDGPIVGQVVEGGRAGVSTCLTYGVTEWLKVGWFGFHDPESGLSTIEVGLGTSPFAVDLLPLRYAGQSRSGQVTLELTGTPVAGLMRGRIFATVRAVNWAGLSTNASSAKGFLILDASRNAICM